MTGSEEPDAGSGPRTTMRRLVVALGTIAGTALIGVVVNDAYGRLSDDGPESPVSVVAEAANDCPGGAYILPASLLRSLPPWNDLNSDWARNSGGFDSAPTYYLTVQGTSEQAAVLQGLRVLEVQEDDPPEEPVSLSKCFGGGDLVPRRFEVDLDAATPRVTALDGDLDIPGEGGDPAVEFPYTVSQTDPEVFTITVTNSECFCTFVLELQWASGGKSGVTRVQLADGPFAVAPFTAEVGANYGYSSAGELISRD